MAITAVQSITASGATTATAAHFGSDPTIGNDILVGCFVDKAVSNRINSVTDAPGNQYIRVGTGFTGTGQAVELWQAKVVAVTAGNHTVTVTSNSGDNIIFVACEFSGLASYNSYDCMAGGSGTGTTITVGPTQNTQNTNSLLVCIAGETAVRPFTLANGYTKQQENEAGSNGICFLYKTVSSIGAYTGDCTIDLSNNWVALVAAFSDTPLDQNKPSNNIRNLKVGDGMSRSELAS